MPPEQLRGSSREPTVDLFAVGAILHELLEGRRLRPANAERELYAMVLAGQRPRLQTPVPAELARLHAALLEPDPNRRIQSADEALSLLCRWPGFRHCPAELGGFVRGRSGHRDVVRCEPTARVTHAIQMEAQHAPSQVTVAEHELREEPSPARTRTYVRPSEPTDPTMIVVDGGHARSLASAVAVGLSTLVISIGLFVLGSRLGYFETVAQEGQAHVEPHLDPPVEEVAAPGQGRCVSGDSQVAIPSEPSLVAVPPNPTTLVAGETPTPSGPDRTAPDLPNPPRNVDSRRKRVSKAASGVAPGPPSRVKFVLGAGVRYAQVEIAGRELSLEPNAEVSLAPGSYVVRTRASEDDAWAVSATLEIRAGKPLKVALQASGGLLTTSL